MMKWLAVVLAAGAIATPAFAQDTPHEGGPLSGAWKLSAKVASVPFNLICRFAQTGSRLEGSCVKASANKTAAANAAPIPLTAGTVDGAHVTFKHNGKFLLKTFDVNYAGVVNGDEMTGHIDVFGHSGDFVAVRAGA